MSPGAGVAAQCAGDRGLHPDVGTALPAAVTCFDPHRAPAARAARPGPRPIRPCRPHPVISPVRVWN